MSNYLPDNNSFNVSSVQAPVIQQTDIEQILKKEISSTLDTVSAAEKQKEKQQAQVGQRPSLPPSGKSQDPNYLAIVAEAFSKAFDSMSQGTIQQIKQYTDLQQLDETMSQSVLRSTQLAINKELKEIKLSAEVHAYQEKVEKKDKILGYVMLGIGIALILATVISCAFDAGVSAGLIPEEITGFFGAGAEMTPEEIEMDTFADSSDLTDTSDLDDEDVDPETVENTESQNTSSQDTQNTQQARETSNDLDKSNEENSKSEDSLKKKIGKKLLQVVIGAGFGSPMLVQGIQGLKTSGMLKDTAQAQQQVGEALSVMQQNNAYFQFYQQLLQQTSGVAQEETNDSSQVIETFGDITNAYQQISYGLASRA